MPGGQSHDPVQRVATALRHSLPNGGPVEPEFDRITAVAARELHMPFAQIDLVESERQWPRASWSLGGRSLQLALRALAAMRDQPVIARDARLDPLFADDPDVLGDARVRFYAGAPLISAEGFKLGALSVADIEPRELSNGELDTLRDLASLAVDELALRRAVLAKTMAQTALHIAQAQQREHLLLLRGIVESAGEGILVIARDGRITLVNPAAMKMLGFTEAPRDLEGWRSAGTSFAADGGAPLTAEQSPITRALRGQNTDRLEVCVALRSRPQPAYFSVTGRPIRSDSGELLGGVVTFNDITALREARERVAELAQTDELTGLPNRRAFRKLLSRLFAEAQRGRKFALVLLDIDHFKRINDTFGHQGGDEVLKRVAKTLARRIDASDFVGRYGGEEFCALYLDADLPRALELAEQLRRDIAQMPGHPSVTVSLGVCASTGEFRPDEDALIAYADAALYRAKHEGRNRVWAATPDWTPPAP